MFDFLETSSVEALTSTPLSAVIFDEYESFTLTSKDKFFVIVSNSTNNTARILLLSEIHSLSLDDNETLQFGFVDPSCQSSSPGWPLRNFLALLKQTGQKSVSVIAFRQSPTDCLVCSVTFSSSHSTEMPKVVGWELGTANTSAPRVVNLASMMDPVALAESAVHLNLKLMKWRILPDLDLLTIKNSKVLLLGAGTLGCYVARGLLAWGVSHITFVDNGKVSFSNPVRQPLFEFTDCLHGGTGKAETAAASLKKVFPGICSIGIDMSIPMPGHSIESNSIISERIDKLKALISDHDIVFLLTDSRESRWLPTVLCAAADKVNFSIPDDRL